RRFYSPLGFGPHLGNRSVALAVALSAPAASGAPEGPIHSQGDATMENRDHNPDRDGIDRRGMLRGLAWGGTGLGGSRKGGLPSPRVFGREATTAAAGTDFSFVQISDSHIGFAKEPNKDVTATLKEAVDRINKLPQPPAFVLHTGDLTHLARPAEFDTV